MTSYLTKDTKTKNRIMSTFSKQYVEEYMPEWEWDFDIEQEFDALQPGEFLPIICEGYGFSGLQKTLDGSKQFLYRNAKDQVVEVSYNLADNNTYKQIRGKL